MPLFFGRLVLPLSTFSLAGAGGFPSDAFGSLIVGMAFSVKAGFFAVYSNGTKTACAIEIKTLRQLFASKQFIAMTIKLFWEDSVTLPGMSSWSESEAYMSIKFANAFPVGSTFTPTVSVVSLSSSESISPSLRTFSVLTK